MKTVVIVAVIACLAVVGVVVGMLIFKGDSASNRPDSSDDTSNTSVHSKIVGSLTINEWGVTLPLTEEIRDATYFIHTESGAAALSTKRANEKCQSVRDEGAALSEQDCHLGGFVRFAKSATLPSIYRERSKIDINGYYYFYDRPKTSLSVGNKDSEFEAYEIKTIQAFTRVAPKLHS